MDVKKLETFDDVETFLDNLGMFSMRLGLERVQNAINLLNLRYSCPIVQIVGTNGKGSTASFLHSIAMAHGFKVGLFTSPHFISPLERIRLNNKVLPKQTWANFINQALEVEPNLTYFELLTVVSLLAFNFSEPDILIYEAGLGGKNDATTAISADLLCLTPIGLDHTDLLGNSINKIAEEKSYAIRNGLFSVISSPQPDKVLKIFQTRSQKLNIPFYSLDSETKFSEHMHLVDNQNLGLHGTHQKDNAKLALFTWHMLCEKYLWKFEPKAINKGLESAFIAGRMQRIFTKENINLLLDGAHNLHGLKCLFDNLNFYNITPSAMIFSCLQDKNPSKFVSLIEEYLNAKNLEIPIYIPPIKNNLRSINPTGLVNYFENQNQKYICADFPSAYDMAIKNQQLNLSNSEDSKNSGSSENPILIFGSLYLLAEYFELFPQELNLSLS